MAEVDKKRLIYFIISLLIIGSIAAVFLPAEKLMYFVELLKSIIETLIISL
jgi:archaellum component FlaG (FlaF/FlaG flagellin family)